MRRGGGGGRMGWRGVLLGERGGRRRRILSWFVYCICKNDDGPRFGVCTFDLGERLLMLSLFWILNQPQCYHTRASIFPPICYLLDIELFVLPLWKLEVQLLRALRRRAGGEKRGEGEE